MAYDNTNKGTIGKNKRKESDNHPDLSGQLNIEGVEYWLSGWHKTNAQTGEGFYSLSVKPKEQRQEPNNRQGGHPPSDDLGDSIPFAPCVD